MSTCRGVMQLMFVCLFVAVACACASAQLVGPPPAPPPAARSTSPEARPSKGPQGGRPEQQGMGWGGGGGGGGGSGAVGNPATHPMPRSCLLQQTKLAKKPQKKQWSHRHRHGHRVNQVGELADNALPRVGRQRRGAAVALGAARKDEGQGAA